MRRALVPLLALLAILGLAAVGTGIGLGTIWLPENTVSATADLSQAGPVAVTAPGVMELRPGPVTVIARGQGEGVVHVARIREQDALAWLRGSQHATITGLADENTLATTLTEGEATVPDPAGSVLWTDGAQGRGEASYTWNSTSGRYLLAVAGDGSDAPTSLTMTWPREVSTPAAVPLVVAGTITFMLAAAAAAVLYLRAGRPAGDRVAEPQTGRSHSQQHDLLQKEPSA